MCVKWELKSAPQCEMANYQATNERQMVMSVVHSNVHICEGPSAANRIIASYSRPYSFEGGGFFLLSVTGIIYDRLFCFCVSQVDCKCPLINDLVD